VRGVARTGALASWRSLSLLALAPSACGGGAPLLHPARTLPSGDVRAAAGLSANFALGGFADATRDAVHDATTNPGAGGAPGTDATFARGALVEASVGAGVAPFAGARVGVGWHSDGGLSYTGRGVRADLRRSFDLSGTWSLSVGAGGSATLYGHQQGGDLPGVDLAGLHGWGADVPVLVGYQSTADLYLVWVGARAGWEHVDIGAPASATPIGGSPIALSATRFWGGPLLGFAVGFHHLHVALELDASYATVSGDYGGLHVEVGGLAVAPASALWWRF
jgi:hypothetical protein